MRVRVDNRHGSPPCRSCFRHPLWSGYTHFDRCDASTARTECQRMCACARGATAYNVHISDPGGCAMLELPARETLAYVCHDMQNDYLKEGGRTPEAGRNPHTPQLIENHVRLLTAARAVGLPVFFTGHFLREDYLDAARHGRARSLGSLRDGTWGAEVIDELAPLPGEFLIRKGGGMSAFTGTALEKWLRRLGVSTLIVAGIATQAGVESTVRDARERDYDSIVVGDACDGRSENHEASLLNMGTFAQVVSTEEVVAALG
ncbi:MAG: cysteine hydrolase [Chloroflexi bacterium]|nr:cysteine hydrolase [Chloroflexota bacterium]